MWFSDKFYMKSSNEVRIEFLVKIKTPAMTSKMHLAPFTLAQNFFQSYQGIWSNLSARILLESEFLYVYYQSKFLFREAMVGMGCMRIISYSHLSFLCNIISLHKVTIK